MSPSTESRRLDLYNGLQEVLGTERATTLMTYLPSIESPDLLTRSEFKAEMAELRDEMSGLRAEMGVLEGGLRAEMRELTKRMDRVLLAVVGGLFVILAAVFTSAAVL